MDSRPGRPPGRGDPRGVVAGAIQNLVAARLGRAFIPLAGLFAAGLAAIAVSSPHGWWTASGALAAGAVMLAYGLSVVHSALGRPHRPWTRALAPASLVPSAYGVYVLGWLGLRGLAFVDGSLEMVTAILYVVLGVWVLRSWLGVVEIRRLARVMASNIEGEGESA